MLKNIRMFYQNKKEYKEMRHEDKITYQRVIIDHDNGHVVKEEIIHRRGAEPPFIKLYLDCLCDFKGLSKSFNPVLFELLKYMSYANFEESHGGQIIYLNVALKKQIALNTQKTVKRVEQAITEFVKSGIFKRIATSTYQVNPKFFGKGDWRDISNIRNIKASFDFANGTVETEIILKDKKEKKAV